MKCVLCGYKIEGHGHNPDPLNDSGRCCDFCNERVIERRLKDILNNNCKEVKNER